MFLIIIFFATNDIVFSVGVGIPGFYNQFLSVLIPPHSLAGSCHQCLFLVICPGMLSFVIWGVNTVSGKRMPEFESFQNKRPKM